MLRSRIIFFAVLGVFIIVAALLALSQSSRQEQLLTEATAEALLGTREAAAATATARAAPLRPQASFEPIFAPNANPNLPAYVCGIDAFASYYALLQMQVAGIDVQNGFRLGIVPFDLDDTFSVSEDRRAELLQSGGLDCLFTTLENVALRGQGIITAIVDESAGADQLWARDDVKTLNDMRGKRLAYAQGSVGQFFALYALAVAGINPRTEMQLVPADSVSDAVARFNAGQADIVSGWEPDINRAADSGGVPLLSSEKLRVVTDVIVTARKSISERQRVVQDFHNAWFQTLKVQFEDLPTAARQIAAWGNEDWSGVTAGNAERDLIDLLKSIAQAGLSQNITVMNEPQRVIDRLTYAAAVWSAAGLNAFSGDTTLLVSPLYVINAKREFNTTAAPINPSFLLGSRPDLRELGANEGETLAVLPCRRFDFLPESSQLTNESRAILDRCVFPVLSSSTGTYLKVVGSAAWPKVEGAEYTEADILEVAQARAEAVVEYLVQKGLDPRRFSVSAVLPPPERRNITDSSLQALDRIVEMTLITVGR
jgi:NitT/TauT family transport system substrate-binding protein